MNTIVRPVHCRDALGFDAPECIECEGAGTVTYLRGPHPEQRECDDCLSTGRRLTCPDCTDGTAASGEDSCPTCDGYAALY